MLITIAIPTYNNEETIGNAIQSALDQDYDNEYEILIANNASKDKTKDVIESFKSNKIRVIVNPETYDMYTNHNICLKEAKGDYVLFCHSDDELLPNALTVLSDRIKMRMYPKRYILWGHSIFRDYYKFIRNGGQQVNTIFSGTAAVDSFLYSGLTPSGTCYSRLSLLELGGFPVSSVRSPEMDWVILIVSAFHFFEFEMIDRIYFKRTDASTAVRNMSRDELRITHQDAYDKIFSLLPEQQKHYFLSMQLSCCTLEMLKSLKIYIPYKKYIKLYIKKRISGILKG